MIVPTVGEVKPYTDVTVPKGWWAFEHVQADAHPGWTLHVVQIVGPGFYTNAEWLRADEHSMTRNHVASQLALLIVRHQYPALKGEALRREARKIRNV